MTPLAERLLAELAAKEQLLTGKWEDCLTGDKVFVRDDGHYIIATYPPGFWHTFKKAEFLERFKKL